MLNKDLYEKYLQKKAKKLGVSVESLRTGTSQTTPPSTNNTNVYEVTNIDLSTPQYNSNFVSSDNSLSEKQDIPESHVDTREEKYALIGYPLGHSLSSVIHHAGFKSMSLDATYNLLEINPEDFVDCLKNIKRENYKGFNITIPFKVPVTMFLDKVDVSADVVGAVNTVLVNSDKTLKGYNTDVMGFAKAIPSDVILNGKVAGILGTGGASRAATVALAQSGIKEIRFYTRNIPNSLNLLNYMRRTFPKITFNVFQIENIRDLSMIDILVNTTPIGMLGHSADMSPVDRQPLQTLPKDAIVYDVIYNPKTTRFLKMAEEFGYRTINGVDMLLNQAAAAEEIWTGKSPNIEIMKIAMLESL